MSEQAQAVLRRRAKSFAWAGLLLPREMLADAAVLYAFCRLADDLADDLPPDEARTALTGLERELDGEVPPRSEVVEFLELQRRTGIDPQVPRILLRTLAADAGPVRIADRAELVRFAYGAASTVGLMMCAIMGVRDPAARPFAIDLGLAMQLTNIARDVLEDAERDRIYLPAETTGHLDPAMLLSGDPDTRRAAMEGVRTVLAMADDYYRSAEWGMRFIPPRPRLAIVTAARLYEAIGLRVLRREDCWRSRTVVPRSAKLCLTAGAMRDWLLNPRFRSGRAMRHEPELHSALRGLPGADHGG